MLETKRSVGFARECIGGPWNSGQITKGDKYKVQFSPFSIQKSTFNFSLAPFFFSCLKDNYVIWELISSTQYSFLRQAFTSCFLVALTMQSTVFCSKGITASLLESQVLVNIVQQDIFIIAQIPHSRVITASSSFVFFSFLNKTKIGHKSQCFSNILWRYQISEWLKSMKNSAKNLRHDLMSSSALHW